MGDSVARTNHKVLRGEGAAFRRPSVTSNPDRSFHANDIALAIGNGHRQFAARQLYDSAGELVFPDSLPDGRELRGKIPSGGRIVDRKIRAYRERLGVDPG